MNIPLWPKDLPFREKGRPYDLIYKLYVIGRKISNMSAKTIGRPLANASQQLRYETKSLSRFQSLPVIYSTRHILRTSQPNPCISIRNYSIPPANNTLFGINTQNSNTPSSYFQRSSLPTNTIIRFVPQQTAWIVERMGRFNRILQPGLAILYPIIDRIAYVKSLKETALEIPSQSAITADNVTLELDGVLYTRIFDAYKAR